MSNLTIPEKLLPLLEKPKRFKVVYGGRGSGKSMTVADLLLMKAQTQGTKIGCFREIQNSIEDSVHALLRDEIGRLEIDGFTAEKASVYHKDGGEFRFRGLARNPDAVKSMHGFKIFWVEESQTVSADSLEKLTPTLREAGSELWFTMNKGSSADPMSKRFLEPFQDELDAHGYYEDDLHLIIEMNYTDNPFFPDVLEQERLWDLKHKSRAAYNHIWLGAYNDEVEDSIIPVEWYDAAVDAHVKLGIKPRGIKVLSHDPADSGDAKAVALRHGIVLLMSDDKTTDDVNECCDWATGLAVEHNADLFVYDADGLGVSLRRQINENLEGKRIEIEAFRGSEGVKDSTEIYQGAQFNVKESKPKTNKDIFRNRRAQGYWSLADRFYATYRAIELNEYQDPDSLISICSKGNNIAKLRAEVCRIPRKPNGAGLIQIMTKQEMKSKKIKSPNLADAIYMNFHSDITIQQEFEPLRFAKQW